MGSLSLGSIANRFLNKLGYSLVKSKSNCNDLNKLRLNIGGGDWSSKGWKNLDHPSSWYEKAQKKHKIISYDIRNDTIPFDDNSVDAIFCSHVVEHLEDHYIIEMLKEAFRVLKKGCVMRITCPDAQFLYQVSKQATTYWKWRDSWFNTLQFYKGEKPRMVDYLVREVATPKLKGYVNAIHHNDYLKEFESMEMYDFLDFLTKDLTYREEFPGDHINYWTFEKMEKMLKEVGFSFVVQSKWGACISDEMTSTISFDTTYPIMSLYVDAIK